MPKIGGRGVVCPAEVSWRKWPDPVKEWEALRELEQKDLGRGPRGTPRIVWCWGRAWRAGGVCVERQVSCWNNVSALTLDAPSSVPPAEELPPSLPPVSKDSSPDADLALSPSLSPWRYQQEQTSQRQPTRRRTCLPRPPTTCCPNSCAAPLFKKKMERVLLVRSMS